MCRGQQHLLLPPAVVQMQGELKLQQLLVKTVQQRSLAAAMAQ
jgi:hypothetical protein